MNADPYRSTTDIGSIGRLKQFDTIVLRVYADPLAAQSVKRLHRASFTSYSGTTWRVRKAPMTALQPMSDGTTWTLAPGSPGSSVRIATRLENGKALLALPPGTVRVSELPAMELKHNVLGAAQAEVGDNWAHYRAEFGKSIVDYALPDEEDTIMPAAERDALVRLAAELELQQLPVEEAIKQVTNHFAAFSYSTFRESAPPIGTTALGDFLRNSKSGHCEYFAAATTLLLRAAGIPARYATGFAMVEYSELEGAYVVRARHAHAWARAWLGDRWVDIDTTPPTWFDEEEAQAPVWQHLSDLLRWADYRWSQRGTLAVGAGGYALAALLLALLAWRSLRGKRVRCSAPAGGGAHGTERRGADSEFFSVEEVLSARVSPRRSGEAVSDWSVRISAALDESHRARLQGLIELHQRYRFDPAGLPPREREALRMVALNLARELAGRLASATA